MPFCSNCGQQISENAKFCGNCGSAVALAAQPAPPVPEQTVYTAPEQPFGEPAAPVQEPSYREPSYQPQEPSYREPSYQPQGYAYSAPPPEEPPKKKKTGVIIGAAVAAVVVVAIVLVLLLGGGGGGNFTGYWECESMNQDGDVVSDEFLGIDLEDIFSFVLYDDDTFKMNLFGEVVEGTWSSTKDSVTLTVDGDPLTLPYVDEQLVMDLTDEGESIVLYFEYADSKEPDDFGTFFGFDDEPVDEPAIEAPADEPAIEEPSEAPAEPEPDDAPVSAQLGEDAYYDFGDYTVEILGGQPCSDDYSGNCFRIFYRFTNNSDEPESAFMPFFFYAYQGGTELEYAWVSDDTPEDDYSSLSVMPGTTIICTEVYELIDDSPLEFYICEDWELNDKECAYASFNVDEDTAAGIHHEFVTVSNPTWTDGMSDEADWDNLYAFINSAEFASSWMGTDDLIRVYYDWTNKSDEATSFWMETTVLVFQDDVQLSYGFPDESTVSDDLFSSNIEPGASKSVSECYELRSDSPVVVLVYNWVEDEYIGCVFSLD